MQLFQIKCTQFSHDIDNPTGAIVRQEAHSPEDTTMVHKAWCQACAAVVPIWFNPVTPEPVSTEARWNLSEIEDLVMSHPHGCDGGKRRFLRDEFGWSSPNPVNPYIGREIELVAVIRYTLGGDLPYDEDEEQTMEAAVRCAWEEDNLCDNVTGLDSPYVHSVTITVL